MYVEKSGRLWGFTGTGQRSAHLSRTRAALLSLVAAHLAHLARRRVLVPAPLRCRLVSVVVFLAFVASPLPCSAGTGGGHVEDRPQRRPIARAHAHPHTPAAVLLHTAVDPLQVEVQVRWQRRHLGWVWDPNPPNGSNPSFIPIAPVQWSEKEPSIRGSVFWFGMGAGAGSVFWFGMGAGQRGWGSGWGWAQGAGVGVWFEMGTGAGGGIQVWNG
ncbi:hypothetical protein B0H14DRAFT_2651140, partial [Mycena olivaceomarginata]